jgi:signal transduction histidine kinase/DNA-binding LacI/PurR family transcriptional regulator/DNA-binding response OmpR family regulator
MHIKARARPTIGFLSTYSVYEGTTIDNYTHAFLRGVCAAAREIDCNLLVGCGISLPGSPLASRTAWSITDKDMDFVPVGPWNADGLIIIPDDLTDSQFQYVQELIRSGYPVVFTTAEKPGPHVAVDNAGGIRQAFDHLLQHGHSRIAFIAGKKGRGGDSAERLAAYRQALREIGIEEDERLIAFGEHRREEGRLAMQKILDSGAPFTAMIASNDLSCIGAMHMLRASGRRIPEDVAVIGFDDVLEARTQLPLLTTVRHPTYTLGYQALLSILELINGRKPDEIGTRVATKLVIRQSCGCHPEHISASSFDSSKTMDLTTYQNALAQMMADCTFVEITYGTHEEIETLCLCLVKGFFSSLEQHDSMPFDNATKRIADWVELNKEDAYAWYSAFYILRNSLKGVLSLIPDSDLDLANSMVDRAQHVIADIAQRQAATALLRHMETSDRLGLMTSQLLAALDISSIADIMANHLPQLGIQHVLVARFSPREDDPLSHATVLLNTGMLESTTGDEFLTHQFPPLGLFPAEGTFQLAILPLVIDEITSGFVALSATHLELCAAIVHNLASAVRSIQLYHDALEGRNLAEEANRLKSRFLSMVSHELRTPLSLIVGLSEMVLHEGPRLTDVNMRDIEQINTSAQHLARLIGDVLDLASSEAGRLRILREPLNLTEVLRVAVKIGEQMAHEKGLAWNAKLPDQGPWIIGDRTRLRQVTLNLISNAVKFTSEGQVTLKVTIEDKRVLISISDTGIGIPPSEQEVIFHEFYRSEHTIQSGYGGLGLGLAITKQLVEQHGGRIGVRSPGDLGSGSTFFFDLPISSTGAPQRELYTPLAAYGDSVMVLTEREDPADQLCTYLRNRGFDIRICCLDEQIDWLSDVIAIPPTVLIMGNRLAMRMGWAIIGMLKRQPITENIPVLVYSLDTENDRGEFLELNYRHKPLHPEKLADELTRYLQIKSGQHTVLIVDDDQNILELHSRIVKQMGCQAITAHNGIEALNEIRNNQPDLILLDLVMPEMDGFAVLDVLRKNETMRNIPVIVLTARLLSEADLERCNRGVSAILSKGLLNTAETLDLIEAALVRQHTLGKATQQHVRQAMTCIHTRYDEPLSREDIAHHVGINADYLTDCFRKELSITPVIYLRRYRILKAQELLETTDFSITQVALEVGFSGCAHFSRTFHREVGMTPSAYRRNRGG